MRWFDKIDPGDDLRLRDALEKRKHEAEQDGQEQMRRIMYSLRAVPPSAPADRSDVGSSRLPVKDGTASLSSPAPEYRLNAASRFRASQFESAAETFQLPPSFVVGSGSLEGLERNGSSADAQADLSLILIVFVRQRPRRSSRSAADRRHAYDGRSPSPSSRQEDRRPSQISDRPRDCSAPRPSPRRSPPARSAATPKAASPAACRCRSTAPTGR